MRLGWPRAHWWSRSLASHTEHVAGMSSLWKAPNWEQVDHSSWFAQGQSLFTPVSLEELLTAPPFYSQKCPSLDDQLYGHPEQDSCNVGALPPHATGSQTHRADRAQCPHFTWGHGRQSSVRDPCYLNNKVYREHLCFSWRKALYLFFPLHFHFSSISISLIY